MGFHRFPTNLNPFSNFGNRKFISSNGMREAIYSRDGKLVYHRTNAGTANYASPTDDPEGHVLYDVIPYFLFGNGPPLIAADCGCEI